MKHHILGWLLLIIATVCSSCFEIVEEIQLQENGSGQFTFIVNMSESKVKLHSVMSLDSVQGYKVPTKAEINQQMSNIRQRLGNIQGLTNAQVSFDYNEFIGTVKFSFKSVDQINAAMSVIMDAYKVKDYSVPYYQYNATHRLFTRTFNTLPKTLAQYNRLKKEDREIFQKARFTSVFKFSREVRESGNTLARVSNNKKAVMQQTSMHNVITNTTRINQSITLEK